MANMDTSKLSIKARKCNVRVHVHVDCIVVYYLDTIILFKLVTFYNAMFDITLFFVTMGPSLHRRGMYMYM